MNIESGTFAFSPSSDHSPYHFAKEGIAIISGFIRPDRRVTKEQLHLMLSKKLPMKKR